MRSLREYDSAREAVSLMVQFIGSEDTSGSATDAQ